MQALFFISLGATCLGGAIALGALFHRFSHKPARVVANDSRAKTQNSACDSVAKLVELERRERSFNALCRRANDELDEKRRALEALTLRANDAAEALGRALDSVALTFGTNSSLSGYVPRDYACASPFELNDFDLASRIDPTRRCDVYSRERQAKAA